MKHESILRITTKLLLPYILLFALYTQFHGDFGPGGGFQAGVIFAAGVILYGLVFGLDAAQRVAPPRLLEICIALGVLIYGGVGLLAMLRGGRFLDYYRLPVAHGQHYGILFVELGVGLTVAAAMVSIFFAFAGREHLR